MSLLLGIFVENIFPLFAAIAAGVLFGRIFNPNLQTLSRATFYIFGPCLAFSSLVNTTIDGAEIVQLTTFTITVTLAVGALTWGVCRLLRLERGVTAAVMLATMFVNSGNFGLILNLFAFGDSVLARAVIYWVMGALMVYSLGVLIASSGKANFGTALKGVLKVPGLYAVLLAGLLIAANGSLPTPLMRPIALLGEAALPVMSVVLGVQISRIRRPQPQHFSGIGIATGIRLIAAPLLALGLATLFQLSGGTRQASILQASMPTAVITTILAIEYEAEPTLVTGTVVATTLLSPLTLTPLIAFLQA